MANLIKKLENFQKKLKQKIIHSSERRPGHLLKWRNWEHVAGKWGIYAPPARPSGGDIGLYEDFLKDAREKDNVLLLGSTPELRDILARKGVSAIVADFSFSMIKTMLQFTSQADEEREKWLKLNWLDLDKFLKEKNFKFIAGDLVLRNIDYDRQERFLNIICRLLEPDGFFISRFHFINEEYLGKDPDALIERSFVEYKNLSGPALEDLIASRLLTKNTDFKNHNVNKRGFGNDILNYIKKSAKNANEVVILKNVMNKWGGYITWTQRKQEELEAFLGKFFWIEERKAASDYSEAEFFPVYKLKKK